MILRLWPPVGYHLPSKDEDSLFDTIYHPKGMVLSDPLSQPVVEAKVLVNQKASHLFSLGFKSDRRSLQDNGSSLNGFLLIPQIQK